jgi:hypothetical protein
MHPTRNIGTERKSIPVNEYDELRWLEEKVVSQFGGCLKCPSCHTLGFYDARFEELYGKPRFYRACKFCGFWQEAKGPVFEELGGAAYSCRMFHCAECSSDTESYPLGLYDWRPPLETEAKCRHCGRDMFEVKSPAEDPGHPYHLWKDLIDVGARL